MGIVRRVESVIFSAEPQAERKFYAAKQLISSEPELGFKPEVGGGTVGAVGVLLTSHVSALYPDREE